MYIFVESVWKNPVNSPDNHQTMQFCWQYTKAMPSLNQEVNGAEHVPPQLTSHNSTLWPHNGISQKIRSGFLGTLASYWFFQLVNIWSRYVLKTNVLQMCCKTCCMLRETLLTDDHMRGHIFTGRNSCSYRLMSSMHAACMCSHAIRHLTFIWHSE